MSDLSFGRRALEAATAADLLELERGSQRADLFKDIDVVVTGLMVRALRGERVVALTRTERGDAIRLVNIPDALRDAVRHAFELEGQQARGAWFLPEAVPIKARTLLFGAMFRESPRYAHTLAAEEKGKVALTGNPDAMVIWSVLQPFADLLLEPIFMRVEESGTMTRDEHASRWTEIRAAFADLGLSVDAELHPYSWGGAWARFSAEEQLAAKGRLLAVIASQLDANTIRRFRARATKALVTQYYAKAKGGRAKRKQVITKGLAPWLAGFFGGDWLALVRYLGEEPHEEERIVTALPEAKVIVGGKSKAAEIAVKRGIPVEEAERILEAFWKDAGGNSPVLERVGALRSYWQVFDELHARQSRGMPSLWGLVEDGGWVALHVETTSPYQPTLYRRLVPPALVAHIEQLWGTTVLTKWPDCVVSEPFPHSAMAETFGAALKFWHGCALTAWFVCEGPTSRTDIPGLAEYHERELVALEDLGCPVHPSLFEELKRVPLGPEEPIYATNESISTGYGVSLSVRTSSGSRRQGFQLLRDVITRHRRWWASQSLEPCLRALWERELKGTARQFHKMAEEKGKPPTLKQFAKYAVEPARRWFGGDLGLLYSAIGQKLAGDGVRRSLLMPPDRVGFAGAVFTALGGVPHRPGPTIGDPAQAQANATERDRDHGLRRLASESLSYVQLAEALGRPPTLKEFGSKFEWPSKVISPDVDSAWVTFSLTVDRLLASSRATPR